MHCYSNSIVIVWNLYIKTFKRFLHVSILRLSSGSKYCSSLKLYVKTINNLLYVPVIQQHIVCMCICFICCRQVGPADQPACKGYNIYTYTRNAAASPEHIINYLSFLTYNFSKEQYVLPEDNLRIETCRSLLNVLV